MGVERFLHPLERCCRRRSGLGGSPLCGGHWSGDGLAQVVLPMQAIRRVMRPQVLCNVRQQSRGLIAGRLDPLIVEPRQGLRHPLLPSVLIACLGRLLQE
jgi:hypothetical protein